MFFMKIFYRLKQFFHTFRRNAKAGEFLLSLETLFLGLVLLFPSDTFSLSYSYDYLGQVADENYWSIMFLFISFLQFFGMFLNKKKVRLLGLLLATGMYFALSTMFFLGSYYTTAWGTYFIYGVFAAYYHIKVAKEG